VSGSSSENASVLVDEFANGDNIGDLRGWRGAWWSSSPVAAFALGVIHTAIPEMGASDASEAIHWPPPEDRPPDNVLQRDRPKEA